MINQLLSAAAPVAVSSSFTAEQEHWHRLAAGGTTYSTSGVHVSEARALQLPVVLDCLSVLSQTVAALPLHIYESVGENERRRADDHPLADVLRKQPNDTNTAYEFFERMMWQCAWGRNAYAEIIPGPRGAVDQLVPLTDVRVVAQNDGSHIYLVREGSRERVLLPEEVWHWRRSPVDTQGLCGLSVMATNREVLGRALAIQQYGATFFANGGMSGGVITGRGFGTQDDQDRFMEAWRRARTGHNAHKDAILPSGMEYKPNEVSNDSAQFNETEKQQDVQLARIWRMPPHKVGIMEQATFSNIEQQAIEFVQDTILPWLTMIEQAISRDLIVGPGSDRYFAQFNVNGLLRGDTQSRFNAYAQAIQNGWMSPNDVRRLENLNPVTGGETYYRNAALVPLDAPADTAAGASTQAQLDAIMGLLEKTKEQVEAGDGEQ